MNPLDHFLFLRLVFYKHFFRKILSAFQIHFLIRSEEVRCLARKCISVLIIILGWAHMMSMLATAMTIILTKCYQSLLSLLFLFKMIIVFVAVTVTWKHVIIFWSVYKWSVLCLDEWSAESVLLVLNIYFMLFFLLMWIYCDVRV